MVSETSCGSTVRVVIEQSPRSNARTFHVAAELSSKASTDFSFPVDDDGYYFRLIGEFGQTLLLALQSRVRGLRHLRLTRYGIEGVTISPAFDWDDVEPGILNVLTDLLDSELDVRRESDEPAFGMGFVITLEDLLAAADNGFFTSEANVADPDGSQSFSNVAGDLFDDSAEAAEYTDDDVEHFDGRVGGWPTG